jgi:hypothetical protein
LDPPQLDLDLVNRHRDSGSHPSWVTVLWTSRLGQPNLVGIQDTTSHPSALFGAWFLGGRTPRWDEHNMERAAHNHPGIWDPGVLGLNLSYTSGFLDLASLWTDGAGFGTVNPHTHACLSVQHTFSTGIRPSSPLVPPVEGHMERPSLP